MNKNSHKYDKPKILAVDIDTAVIDNLLEDGFNIDIGTFGKSYSASEGQECGLNGNLPYLLEKDIVIVNLNRDDTLDGENPAINREINKANRTILTVGPNQNYFNPAFVYSKYFQDEFIKIIDNGGVIIVFTNKPEYEDYLVKTFQGSYNLKTDLERISNFDWIPTSLNPEACITGKEICTDNDLANIILKDCRDEVKYNCIFPYISTQNANYVLIKNILGETIGFIREIQRNDKTGYFIILPQFSNLYKPIINLFQEFLPIIKPEMFPDFVENNWIDNDEYIFPKVKELIYEKENIVKDFENKLKEADDRINRARDEYSFLTNILVAQGYDEFLVDNIYKTLEFIGYQEICNVDDIIEGNRQEDLRILDDGRFTVIEIKGHNGNPTEDDCQALLKYINRNMRKENRTDIHGILIVNHQKMLEPMERKYPAYTMEQINDALRDKYTLVDTWQLFQAARLLQEGLTTFDDIDMDLHIPGLFSAIPSSWKLIGKIEKYYDKVMIVGVILDVDEIKVDDEIIIQNGNDYFKQTINSLRVNDTEVNIAKKGDPVTFKVNKEISRKANIYIKLQNK